LFLVTGGSTYTALTPATTFRSGAAASFFVNPLDVTVPGIAAGESATVVVRAWLGASYDTAAATGTAGQSAPLTIAGLGGVNPTTGAIVPTPDLAGLQSFNLVTIPEPSTIALGVLGAAALLYRRRK
jgi:hypothetical protein